MARPALQGYSGIIKTCPLCEEQFECAQGHLGCWCEAVVLGRRTLADIRAVAYGCVCPACLSGFAARERARRDSDLDGVDANTGPVTWAKAVPHSAVRSRGVSAVWALVALGSLAGALLLGLGTGAASIGPASIVASLLSHFQVFHVASPLSTGNDAILWQIRPPRAVPAPLGCRILPSPSSPAPAPL